MSAGIPRSRRKTHLLVRNAFLLSALLAAATSGCAVVPQNTAPQTAPARQTPVRPLPFKGRLVDGDPRELPPAVAMSLSGTSPVEFHYREELTHDEYHIPLIFSAIDPVTYVGAPLGDYGVTAFVSLSIIDAGRVLGDYTAKAHVSQPYNLYSAPTHRELEQAALAAARDKIDQKLYSDADRLTQAIAGDRKPPAEPVRP